ncbi:GxxExxY protein [uncultured Candidatus Kuenenia sp.]|uniref:GxxExxY protein n=1 Tax=uncultured Candidatus Kuenenia sp. TaxID=1048336 RepID=UPI00030166E8|nr:GxxExxY protein [uncultured Candidatus Kuenenia sp.]
MSTNEDKILYKDLSYKIVGLAMQVHNKLGYGFLEKVYENALMVLFRREGIQAKQQAPITVYFEDEVVGDYYADILVEDKIMLELKSSEGIIDAHRAQTLNYLKATKLRLAIILNFGKEKLEYERIVL